MSPQPAAPCAAYFDPALDVWVLSRYTDVLAAFRDPRLRTVSISGKDQMDVRDDSGRLAARVAMQESLSHPKVAEWQSHFEAVVAGVLAALATDRPVDLLRDFAQPCCLALAARITGVEPSDIARLGAFSAAAFGGTGAAEGSEAQIHAVEATAELNRYFATAAFRMGEPTFVGTAQTMARLLSNGWLALLGHPVAYQGLAAQPQLMATAVEELLRYAGIVPTLYRRGYESVEIGAASIAEGQRVHLKIASANRDPDQFPDPDRLDLGRRAVNHLALGIGRNSCVGNLVIRMASSVASGALVHTFPQAQIAGDVDWRNTSSFCWPASLPVLLGPRSAS